MANGKNPLIPIIALWSMLLAGCADDYIGLIPGEDDSLPGDMNQDTSDDSSTLADTDIDSGDPLNGGTDTGTTYSTDGTHPDTGSDADTGDDDDDTEADICAAEEFDIDLMPLDMLLALDTSYSMDYVVGSDATTKWQAISGAVKDFVTDDMFAGLGVGIQFFPARKLCSVDAYATPAVPISMLPDAATDISAALDSQRMASGTPMAPMLQGVLAYAQEWAGAHTDRRTVVVLASDGIPDTTCLSDADGALPNTLENVSGLAADAAAASPTVTTYVIGVGTELAALNQISQAGNGEDAFFVDVQDSNVHKAFLDSLETIRRRTACDYDVSLIGGEKSIDFKKVNIGFQLGSTDETFANVGDADGCVNAPEAGWYYDNPDSPKKIVLCEETCEKVQASVGGRLKIAFGCRMIIV